MQLLTFIFGEQRFSAKLLQMRIDDNRVVKRTENIQIEDKKIIETNYNNSENRVDGALRAKLKDEKKG